MYMTEQHKLGERRASSDASPSRSPEMRAKAAASSERSRASNARFDAAPLCCSVAASLYQTFC